VFLQFLARASGGRHYSYVENCWCLELGTGTPEDMLLTNFGVNHCKSINGFVLMEAISITSMSTNQSLQLRNLETETATEPDSLMYCAEMEISAGEIPQVQAFAQNLTHSTYALLLMALKQNLKVLRQRLTTDLDNSRMVRKGLGLVTGKEVVTKRSNAFNA